MTTTTKTQPTTLTSAETAAEIWAANVNSHHPHGFALSESVAFEFRNTQTKDAFAWLWQDGNWLLEEAFAEEAEESDILFPPYSSLWQTLRRRTVRYYHFKLEGLAESLMQNAINVLIDWHQVADALVYIK